MIDRSKNLYNLIVLHIKYLLLRDYENIISFYACGNGIGSRVCGND